MGTDYDAEKKIGKRLIRGTVGTFIVGAAIALGGTGYSIINNPSIPPLVERYEQIGRKLNNPINHTRGLKSVEALTLGNLESRSAELIAHANNLRDGLSKIASDPTFAKTKEDYESEKQKYEKIENYSIFGGIGLMLSIFIPLFLVARRRSTIEEDESRCIHGTM